MQQNATLLVMINGVDGDVEPHFKVRIESCAVALCTAASDASGRPCEEPRQKCRHRAASPETHFWCLEVGI